MWRERDEFKGLVVTLKDAMSDSFSPPEFEVLFGRVPHFERVEPSVDVGRRITSLEVSISKHSSCILLLHRIYQLLLIPTLMTFTRCW